MKNLIIISALLITVFSCNKIEVPSTTPACVKKKIKQILKGGVWNPPAKVYSYSYQGEAVYYFPPRCCDVPSELFDKDCNLICQPEGRYWGGTYGICPSPFFTERTNEVLIWEDTRERK